MTLICLMCAVLLLGCVKYWEVVRNFRRLHGEKKMSTYKKCLYTCMRQTWSCFKLCTTAVLNSIDRINSTLAR